MVKFARMTRDSSLWMRFRRDDRAGFGLLDGDEVAVHDGDMFGTCRPTGERLRLDSIEWLPPSRPSKFICIWNNFHAAAAKQGLTIPAEPLYVIKGANAYCAHGQPIRTPASYDGRVVYEGELGIVIGRHCSNAAPEEAAQAIFGYTCVNDVTAIEIVGRDAAFAQWTRAKSFDTFGVFGPVVATGIDPSGLSVRTLLGGRERQNFPLTDMIFPPAQLVSLISRDMTLEPGDLIACGTSLGVLPMKAGNVVEVSIDGIGVLRNEYRQERG